MRADEVCDRRLCGGARWGDVGIRGGKKKTPSDWMAEVTGISPAANIRMLTAYEQARRRGAANANPFARMRFAVGIGVAARAVSMLAYRASKKKTTDSAARS